MVVARRPVNMARVKRALLRLPGGARKWDLVQAAGPMEPLPPPKSGPRTSTIYVQRVGLSTREAAGLVRATTLHGNLPEPLRLAHLIAGAYVTGQSRGRA